MTQKIVRAVLDRLVVGDFAVVGAGDVAVIETRPVTQAPSRQSLWERLARHGHVQKQRKRQFSKAAQRAPGPAKPQALYVKLDPELAEQFLATGTLLLTSTPSSAEAASPSADRPPIAAELRGALERAYERAEESEAEILGGDDMLTSDGIAQRLKITRETVNRWRHKGDLLGLEGDARGVRYPAWQIIRGRRLAGLREVAGYLARDPWAVYRFLTEQHDALDGQTGVEALRKGRQAEVFAVAEGLASGAPG